MIVLNFCALYFLASMPLAVGAPLNEPPPTDDSSVSTEAVGSYLPSVSTLERRGTQLQDEVFKTKANLRMLLGLLAHQTNGAVELWHINKIGPAYTIESVQYYIDDQMVFTQTPRTGSLDHVKERLVVERPLASGEHQLDVHITMRGKDHGVIAYLDDYTVKAHSTIVFDVEAGEKTVLRTLQSMRFGDAYLSRIQVDFETRMEALPEGE